MDPVRSESLGVMLNRFRTERGMSKYRLAARSGVSHANIFGIEHGKRGTTAGSIAALADALELTATERLALFDAAAAYALPRWAKS